MPEERNFAAPRLQPWWIRLALALPFLAIVATAVPQLADGLAQEAAYTATAYMAMDVPLPRRSYRLTAAILSHASSSDGEAQIARAEAASLAGQSPAMVA
ncbi:MAG: hypothetical protein KJS68_16130, partial [Alphaproteobacteria bacterium]|nr:hypothetical protein [Alphaproteobacteria bacterium]